MIKCKFQHQKLPIDISEKYETFKVSNTVNRFIYIKTFLGLYVMNRQIKKNSVINSFSQKKNNVFLVFFKNWTYRIFLKSAYLLLKLKEMSKRKNNWGSPNSFVK